MRGIHRRLLAFLLIAVGLGGVAGFSLHAASAGGAGVPLCAALAAVLAVWPLGWAATFRIARPLRELAQVAGELREGRLSSRERLPAADGEVGEVAGALGGLADRVTRQLEDQRALMAAVSHELRSPLARLRVQVELARDGVGVPEAYDDLQREIDGMDALVGDLLAAARIDFQAVHPQALDPADVGRRALVAAGLSEGLLDGAAPAVRADPTLLGRALGVLLDNAARYGGRPVRLGLVPGEDEVRFEVDDDGPGFAPGEEDQAFQPFWRRPPGPEGPPPEGTGLGLALVRQIARAHGGSAGAGNRPEGGARVWLALPREPWRS